jgi:4-hydroxyphenylpyruvate dioxygenase
MHREIKATIAAIQGSISIPANIHLTQQQNPMGTDGLEFIELAAPDSVPLAGFLGRIGFSAVARHRSKDVTLYRQGQINLLINSDVSSLARSFVNLRAPSLCAIAIRVKDAGSAYRRAADDVAVEEADRAGVMELNIPAIVGIGGSSIYLVDRYGDVSIFDIDFVPLPETHSHVPGAGLVAVDRITYHVRRADMQHWIDRYRELFNFSDESVSIDAGGLRQRHLMVSPCNKIRIELAAEADGDAEKPDASDASDGAGACIALVAQDIFSTAEFLDRNGVAPIKPERDNDEDLIRRIPAHNQKPDRMWRHGIRVEKILGVENALALRLLARPWGESLTFEFVQRIDL